jgi:hypothetical protein
VRLNPSSRFATFYPRTYVVLLIRDPAWRAILMGYKQRRHTMTSNYLIGSAFEITLVLAAGAIFLAMVIAAVAAVVWFVAGLLSAAHQTQTGAR